jgi:hypothetical protein
MFLTMRSKFSISVIGALLVGALGCGLISTDIAKFTFKLPAKTYEFGVSASQIPAGGTGPKITCGAGGMVATCPAPLSCEAGVCTGFVPLSVVQKMDLRKDAAELADYTSAENLAIERIQYSVVSTANIDVPTIDIYLAPAGVTDPNSPDAKKFGSVPPILAGTSRTGDVVKEPDADAVFQSFAADINAPFNFIAATTVPIPTGSPTPTGSVKITINGELSAKVF